MIYFKKIFFLFIFNYFLISQTIEYKIFGEIIDQSTLQPIQNVNIIIDNYEYGTYSNEFGYFEFNLNKNKNYTIHFSHVGYKKKKLSLKPNFKKNIINLEKSSIEYSPIIVKEAYLEHYISNSPIITEIITKNQIKKYSSTSVLELLEKVLPNIQIMQDSHGTTMTIQGLDSKYFLFLIDGNRMTGETTGNFDFSRLNITNIEKIEILNGGASSAFGSGAIGGVVNIVTNKNFKKFSLVAGSKQYSKNKDQQNWLSLELSNQKKSLNSQTNITTKSSDGYSINGNIIQNIFNDITFNQTFKINLIKKMNIFFSGTFYSHDTEDYNYNNKRRDKYYDKQMISKIEYENSNKYLFKLHWTYDKYDKYTLFEAINDERIRSSHKLNLIKINCFKSFGNTNNQIGIELHEESFFSPSDLEYNPFAGYLGSDSLKNSKINSIFIQNEFLHNSTNHFISGLRYDTSDSFGSHLGPHFSFLKKFNNYNFRLNFSKNFKIPTLKELYMQWDHLGMFYVRGNENLKPEYSKYLSLALEILKPKYNFTIKSHINSLENMIVSVEELNLDQMIYKNYNSATITGIDFIFKSVINNIYFIHSNLSIINPIDTKNNIQIEGTNKIAFNSNLSIDLNNNNTININYKYMGETFFQSEIIASYEIINFSYNYIVNEKWNFSTGIDNLKNTASIDNRMTMYPNKRYYINFSLTL